MTLKTHLKNLLEQRNSYVAYLRCRESLTMDQTLALSAEITKLDTEIKAIEARPMQESDKEITMWSAQKESRINKAYSPGTRIPVKRKKKPEPLVVPDIPSTWSRPL